MKYLFYNCQLLLLCCACCKFAIQAFVQEDRHAIQTTLAKRLLVLPTDLYPSVFHRELQNKLRHFAIITDRYTGGRIPFGISQRVAKQLRYFATITDRPAIIIDVYTNAFTNEWHTFQSARLSEVTDGFAEGHGKTNACVLWRTISNAFADGLRKIWRDFQKFWCKNQLITDKNY